MSAYELAVIRYTGGGLQLAPSSGAVSVSSLPNDDTGTVARYIFVQALNNATGTTFPAATFNLGTSSTVTASSTDIPITSNEARIFDTRGQKWCASWGYTPGTVINVCPHQRG